MDTVTLTALELACSRLCHDLAGPIGAIANGVELIEETGGEAVGDDAAMELIAHSASQASRRLRLFRIAYGKAGNETRPAEAAGALDDYFAGGRVVLAWPPETAISQAFVKTAVNLVLVAADAIGAGGMITVAAEDGRPRVVAEGRAIRLDPGIAQALAGAAPVLDGGMIQAFLAGSFARRAGTVAGLRLVDGEQQPGRLELTLSPISGTGS